MSKKGGIKDTSKDWTKEGTSLTSHTEWMKIQRTVNEDYRKAVRAEQKKRSEKNKK